MRLRGPEQNSCRAGAGLHCTACTACITRKAEPMEAAHPPHRPPTHLAVVAHPLGHIVPVEAQGRQKHREQQALAPLGRRVLHQRASGHRGGEPHLRRAGRQGAGRVTRVVEWSRGGGGAAYAWPRLPGAGKQAKRPSLPPAAGLPASPPAPSPPSLPCKKLTGADVRASSSPDTQVLSSDAPARAGSAPAPLLILPHCLAYVHSMTCDLWHLLLFSLRSSLLLLPGRGPLSLPPLPPPARQSLCVRACVCLSVCG